MTNLTYNETNWSQSFFPDLEQFEHDANNQWFKIMLDSLYPDGKLGVPCLNKSFNKLGEEVDNEIVFRQDWFILKEDIVWHIKN